MNDDYKKMLDPLSALTKSIDDATNAVEQLVRAAPELFRKIELAFEAFHETTAGFARWFRDHERATRIFAVVGWLPHETWPAGLIGSDDDSQNLEEIRDRLALHYQDEWPTVEQQFASSFDRLNVEDETRKVLAEALTSHRDGKYRSVVRLLFPEIENEIRVAFYQNSLKHPIAGLNEFLDALNRKVAFGHVLQREFDMTLFDKLSSHMYSKVDDSNRLAIAADPVPNRHAALHGIVSYSSAQNSINTLIMADYILRLVTSLKRLRNPS
ncbi:hypothetical protein [Mesorhizobium sp.]|uniref:hypothetical protein n=1 Tax=Mesorhizobium sp. TaxID=1871066 RepID=UPI000FE58278|nr:hypothetical protein [Mesorhizobium sp.]RWE34991.1 MAG: hypothetical protein EOS77_08440 [Mesorhizobium sp.]